ncbi:MAG: NUDIX hydrolase [Beijerinckiaceae bacterium]
MSHRITPLRSVDARLQPVDWPFAQERRAEIDTHWAKISSEKLGMFNGTVLLQHGWELSDGCYRCAYSPVDYASFIAWIRFGAPGVPRRNGFAMAALQAADGAFILGRMGEQTANAGLTYFAGGTPDMHDVTADGRVDLDGSMRRELFEETLLRPEEVVIGQDWTLVEDGSRAAFLKPARLPYPADEARRIILERLSAETEPELQDIVIVRTPNEIDVATTPLFAAAYMARAFSGGG